MLSIHTDNVTIVDSERGPSPNAEPKISISDVDDDGYRIVNFSFKIGAGDYWSLSVSKGIEEEKKVFGFGQGSTHQEKPEMVVAKANEWIQEENKKKEYKSLNILSFPPSFWERDEGGGNRDA